MLQTCLLLCATKDSKTIFVTDFFVYNSITTQMKAETYMTSHLGKLPVRSSGQQRHVLCEVLGSGLVVVETISRSFLLCFTLYIITNVNMPNCYSILRNKDNNNITVGLFTMLIKNLHVSWINHTGHQIDLTFGHNLMARILEQNCVLHSGCLNHTKSTELIDCTTLANSGGSSKVGRCL